MAKTERIGDATLEALSPDEVRARFERNEIVLVDVRTPAEFVFEHIPGAMLFPMANFDPAKLPSQADKPLVFHCGSGVRSKKMAERCAQAGMTRLAHMEGGLGAWKNSGLPYSSIDPASGAPINKP